MRWTGDIDKGAAVTTGGMRDLYILKKELYWVLCCR